MNLNIRDYIHMKYCSSKYLWETMIIDIIEIKETYKILDVGCGDASFWERNINRFPHGIELTLIDKYNTVDKMLQERLKADFICCDICEMTYEKEFDVVIAKDVMYLVDDFNKCTYTIAKAIKHNGIVYGTYYSIDHMRDIYKIISGIGLCSGHCNQYRTFNSKNAERKLSSFFSSIKVFPKEDTLKITNINDAVLFIMSYLNKEYHTDSVKKIIFDYIKNIFKHEGELIVNRKMYLFVATGSLI